MHRAHLVDTIHANIPRKLIILAAPAGYGKTTLLADFTKHTELPVCWVRLTEADQDVFRFTHVLTLSLQRRFRRLQGAFDLERLSALSPEALARSFIDVIDANVSEAFVIAIDDVHLINHSQPTTAFLDLFLEELPEQITIIAAGREVLEVSLARLMAEGNLSGLGPQDLALAREEIIQLAKVHSGVEISIKDVERLQAETRGWITGVILSTELSGRGLGGLMASDKPLVYEYLASVVLNRQPDDIRRFMLDTSVYPIMTVAGCDHLLRRNDSNRFLNRLVRFGLFVTATEEGLKTFVYHPQFREFLFETLKSADTKRWRSLLVRAAKYLAQHDSPEHAVELFFDAGAHQRAASLADKRAQEMFRSGRWQTLEAWASRLDEFAAPAPRVFLYLAAYYENQGKLDEAEIALERASAMLHSKSSKALRAFAEIVRGHLALDRRKYDEALEAAEIGERILAPSGSRQRKADCYRLRALAKFSVGDLQAAETHASQAINILQRTNAKLALAAALVDYSNIEYALGNFPEAHASALRAHEIYLEMGAPLMLAISFNNLAYDAHQQGQYEEALELYNEGLKFARQAVSPPREIRILFGQADLFADLDLALQAAELYGQGLNLAIQIEDLYLIRYGCVRTSVLHRRRSGSGLAHEWLRRAITLEDVVPPPEIVIQMASLEASVKPVQARQTLEKLLDDNALDAENTTLALYFIARAELERGDEEATKVFLERAINWAGRKSTEQVLAGEMAFDDEIREFARKKLGKPPVLSVVYRRVETLRAVAQQYQQVTEETDTGVSLTFRALGDTSVQRSDQAFMDLKPLAREVLFYLIDNQRVERDVLLEIFWPHHPP
ncbi:MAG: tetratricopeptide repeat protein, partial [Anaerolineales bacterium]|nr:tetratricopeptide repeat protein [Anaerolineales bacterium]